MRIYVDELTPLLLNDVRFSFWEHRENDRAYKAGKLYSNGWKGLCLYSYSPYEINIINTFLNTIPKWSVEKISYHKLCNSNCILGNFKNQEMSIFFKYEKDFTNFKTILYNIGKRTSGVSFTIKCFNYYRSNIIKIMQHKNCLILKGTKRIGLSYYAINGINISDFKNMNK